MSCADNRYCIRTCETQGYIWEKIETLIGLQRLMKECSLLLNLFSVLLSKSVMWYTINNSCSSQ